MEKGNINTREYWNINYREVGFYQDNSVADWKFCHDNLKRVLPKTPCRILEVACGLAHNAKFTASLGHFVIATDFSQIAIDENIKRFSDPKIRYECMDLEKATEIFKENDVVMGFEILEHFKDPLVPMLKISKALKDGGLFVFTVPHEKGKLAVWCQHYFLFNYENMGELLFKAGFKEFTVYKTMFAKEDILCVATKGGVEND
jgi:2-polyprenyl-3-methyl-5-hydroxy-6-metoxy-1,4-benzoquinol methylase